MQAKDLMRVSLLNSLFSPFKSYPIMPVGRMPIGKSYCWRAWYADSFSSSAVANEEAGRETRVRKRRIPVGNAMGDVLLGWG
ncbi:hypothetical protein V6N13_004759 [Hibiscus sabdariffa]